MKNESQEHENFYISPIANPLAGSSISGKILKLARHLNRQKKLKRGVKDVVKSINKGIQGIVILAADVSPVDVISHIPVICQEHSIPYIFVRSRMQLGVAAETKKPTSVILMAAPSDQKINEKYEKLFKRIKQSHPYL